MLAHEVHEMNAETEAIIDLVPAPEIRIRPGDIWQSEPGKYWGITRKAHERVYVIRMQAWRVDGQSGWTAIDAFDEEFIWLDDQFAAPGMVLVCEQGMPVTDNPARAGRTGGK